MNGGSAAQPPRHIDECVFGRCVIGIWRPNGLSARAALIVAASVNCVIFGWGAQSAGLPRLPGFDGSLLLQPSPVMALAVVGVLLVLATLAGTVLAGAVRFEAGLFAATLGLAAISVRAGTMQSVLFESGGSAEVYSKLAVEQIILTIMVVAMWAMLWGLGMARLVRPVEDDEIADPADGQPEDLAFGAGIAATITQVVATAILLMFFCQTTIKGQVLASVGIASVGGTFVSYICFPTRPSIWYWMGPLVVGLIGYTLAASGQNVQLAIGDPQGVFAALARPLPVDYASVGTAGAILGYWLARRKNTATTL